MKRAREPEGEPLRQTMVRLRREPYEAATHVRFLVGEERRPFHAHRWLVQARMQKYGHSMHAGFAESSSNEWMLPDHEPATFEEALAFLYTDECSALRGRASDIAGVIRLWQLADELLFEWLSSACRTHITSHVDRENCPLALEAALRVGFETATDAVWEIVETEALKVKSCVELKNGGRSVTLIREAWALPFCRGLLQALMEADSPPEAIRVRFFELFMRDAPCLDIGVLLSRATEDACLRPVVPLYAIDPRFLVGAQPKAPWLTDSVIVQALRQRYDYLYQLASKPSVWCRKSPRAPLEFTSLQWLHAWMDGQGFNATFTLFHGQANSIVVSPPENDDNDGDDSHGIWLVGDSPSLDFGFVLYGPEAIVRIGLLARYMSPSFSVAFEARFSGQGARLRIVRPGSRRLSPTWLAQFTFDDQDPQTKEFNVSADSDSFPLFLPALHIRFLHKTSSVRISTHGERWRGEHNPLVSDDVPSH